MRTNRSLISVVHCKKMMNWWIRNNIINLQSLFTIIHVYIVLILFIEACTYIINFFIGEFRLIDEFYFFLFHEFYLWMKYLSLYFNCCVMLICYYQLIYTNKFLYINLNFYISKTWHSLKSSAEDCPFCSWDSN